MNYRKANIADIDVLVNLRKKQLVDEGVEPNDNIDLELYSFFEAKLTDGTLIQWMVEEDQEIIACGGVIFYDFPPSYTNKSGRKAYFANMYTKDNFRGRGIASNLLTKLVAEVKASGIKNIWLAASPQGRPVYEKFGFKAADEYLELKLL